MFCGCTKITEINLSNFNTSQVKSVNRMFYDCSLLSSIDFSNFNTSKVIDMKSMFEYCSSLKSLDLSNFDTSKVENMFDMFMGCTKLEYINLNNFNDTKLLYASNMFFQVPDNVIICINEIASKGTILSRLKNKKCVVKECTNEWKYEYNNTYYENCSNGFIYDENNNQLCKCELNKCLLCPKVDLNKNLNTKCDIDYYPIENDPSNNDEQINCYNQTPEGYYFDNNSFKKCFYTCKTCNKLGNSIVHNCMECNTNYSIEMKNGNYLNCYENFSYIEYYDKLINAIQQVFTSEYYDKSKLDNGHDVFIETGKITITLTTLENQRKYLNKNMTAIDFGYCETLLKNAYNISKNETIYMKKIDIVQEGMRAIKVEYDVYCKLNGTSLTKLDLTPCSNSKISILIPFEITKNIDEFNSSSGYYNDICYTTTSDEGTDITLKDRKAKYFDDNKIVCQDGCYFSKYDSEKHIANCSCNIKESSFSFKDMAINKTKLLYNFRDIKNFLNYNFLFCYKKLFNKKGIINNLGCYLLLIIILMHILNIIIFYINQFYSIKMKIKYISYGIKGNQKVETHTKIKMKKSKNERRNKKNFNLIEKSDRKAMNTSKLINKKNINKKNN